MLAFLPGLALVGLGLGAMLTPSVNVVQSSFPEALQGEISGLSRSVSDLGSSFGTAIAGTILVSELATGNRVNAWGMISLVVFGLIGLGAALLLPAQDRANHGLSLRPADGKRTERWLVTIDKGDLRRPPAGTPPPTASCASTEPRFERAVAGQLNVMAAALRGESGTIGGDPRLLVLLRAAVPAADAPPARACPRGRSRERTRPDLDGNTFVVSDAAATSRRLPPIPRASSPPTRATSRGWF